MEYKTLHEVVKDGGPKLLVEKKGSKLVYIVREGETSYLLDDGYGGTYFVGKLPGSPALEPIWRRHIKITPG